MADDRYSLAEARAIIDAERCVRPDHLSARCDRHGGWLGHENWLGEGAGVCKNYPEVADVAAQLLATVERVQELADELTEQGNHHVPGCEGQAGCARCVQLDLRKAINGEEVTE